MPRQPKIIRCVYRRHSRTCRAVLSVSRTRRETRDYDPTHVEYLCDLADVDPAAPTGEPHRDTVGGRLLWQMIEQHAVRAVTTTARDKRRVRKPRQPLDVLRKKLTRARTALRAAESDLPAAWAAEAAARSAALAACELDADAAASARAAHKLAVAARVRAAARLRACRRDAERCDAALSAAQQRRDDETPAGRVLDGETRRDGSVRVLLGRGGERWIATYSSETLDRYDEITDAAGYVALVRTAQPSRTEFLGHSRRTAFANRKSTL